MTLGRKYQQSSSNAGDLRKVYASQSKVGSLSSCSSTISTCDMIEPPDYEEVASHYLPEGDPLAYPENDVQVVTIPRRIRTVGHVLPDEDLSTTSMFVRDCIHCYTSNYTTVEYKYRCYSSSTFTREKLAERLEKVHAIKHQYEVDMDPLTVSIEELAHTLDTQSQPSSGRQSVASISSSSSCNETLTPRGSWASLDLRSSSSDPLIPDLFEKRSLEEIDAINEARRMENRQDDLISLHMPYLDDDEPVERRLPAEMPCEVMGHRILVTCHQLKLELDVEPFFASMALYDAKEKKKLSENFYFNLNSECTKQMLTPHITHADVSTLSRSAIFDIINPSPDIFLVIRLEKVLQGDVNECVEPYVKEEKNREKVRAGAQTACSRLGKFRMPFAWTAVSLTHILNGSNSLERESDKDSISVSSNNSNSLERKPSSSSLEQLRRRAGEVGGSLARRDRDRERERDRDRERRVGDDVPLLLDTFKAIGITLTSFFKQETDKLRDEDLYKFLLEIKRPSSAPKKLKCIPGTLKIEVSPCPEEIKNGLTPELAKLMPLGDENVRPCKEILPFPLHTPLVPHYQYRNLLYLYPKEINLTAFTSKTVSARNITVKIQLMSGENPESALPAIFGRSSCPEFSTEAYTTVIYHNKNPSLYDEIKLKLPADLGDQHHLLFTFLHVSCQRKVPDAEHQLETVIGYTWAPLCRGGRLPRGELSLPVMPERPPNNYSYICADVQLPGTKWIDNHKPLFTVVLEPFSTVHPLDSHIERFAMACEAVQEGNIPARIGIANMEAELRASITSLPSCHPETLVRYLPVVLNKLLRLLCAAPSLAGATLNIAQDVFTALAQIFSDVTNVNPGDPEAARSPLLSTYVQYQCDVPRPPSSDVGLPLPPAAMGDSSFKILHEELALQWVVASGATRDLAMHNSWPLFELMISSMVQYLSWGRALSASRRTRFPEHYTDDITTLVNNVTAEIISRYGKNSRLTQSLNNSLAFFMFDLLSIADRGYVFGLIKSYCKQMSAKIASLPDAVPLVQYKLSFLRIVCAHEQYVPLCLPPADTVSAPVSAAVSAPGRHYLAALLLGEVVAALDMQSPVLQAAGSAALARRLAAHEVDPRLVSQEARARVAALYGPLLRAVLTLTSRLHRPAAPPADVLQLDDDLGQFPQFHAPSPDSEFKQSRAPLNSSTSRTVLTCLAWLLKWSGRGPVVAASLTMSPLEVATLLQAIALAFAATEYKGRKEILKCAQQNLRKTSDIKAKLEDVILGQGSARSDLIMRRKGVGEGSSCRWRKEWSRSGRSNDVPAPALAAALAADLALTMLQAVELVVQSWSPLEAGGAVAAGALRVLLQALQRAQSAAVLPHLLASVRALVLKMGGAAGSGVWRGVLRLCGSPAPVTRAHAAATLYVLMVLHHQHRHDFGHVKTQVTMSLSSLVGAAVLSEAALRRALKTVLLYAERDVDTDLAEQVKDLVFNLHMILSDTVKMKEVQQDPELLLDLMHRVARGYQHSPDLRLTWLNNMAQKHMERSNHTEAAMCLVAGAALLAESCNLRGRGAALLGDVTHNVLDESRPGAGGGPPATHEIQALLEHAASELMIAGMYETVNEVYKVLIPIAEENRDYKKLANIHAKLHEAFSRMESTAAKRVFGSYFRVAFFGARFAELNGEHFVYKEHALTKLPEIFSRLENFYSQRFGAENVIIIKDSNPVDVSSLDPDKAYIQITYVEPYFEPHELRKRVTNYEMNHNIKRFMYATPFTATGAAHGQLADQCKRKTVLTTARHFPYLKTRIQVVQKTQIILSPIEVAIEDIQKKTTELAVATNQEPPDPKILQMVVQGCIGTTVNQGPLELAQVFLAPVAEGKQPPTKLTNKLRLSFKDFSKKCEDALKKNKLLIGCEQREYQRELERNFTRFRERLAALVTRDDSYVAALSNGVKTDYKFQA